jgi:hypothetical protein
MTKAKRAVGTHAEHSDDATPSIPTANHSAEVGGASAGQQQLELNAPPNDPMDEAIRALAYTKWEAAGRVISDGIEFWLEAEREVCAKTPPDGNSTETSSERV